MAAMSASDFVSDVTVSYSVQTIGLHRRGCVSLQIGQNVGSCRSAPSAIRATDSKLVPRYDAMGSNRQSRMDVRTRARRCGFDPAASCAIYGRDGGVGRGRAIGVARGVAEGVAVGVGVGPP
jgi:hypothetical protein